MKNLIVVAEIPQISEKLQVLKEETTSTGVPKLKYRTVLQTLNERNNNGRYYDESVGQVIVDKLAPKAASRSLIGEFDHPFVVESSDPKTMESVKRRMVRCELKNACNLYTSIWMEGNLIMGEAETLSFSKGPDLFKAILIDQVTIGHSLRAIGSVQPMPDGSFKVVPPIFPVTYDVVINPSHSSAKVVEVTVQEALSIVDDVDATTVITEDYEAVIDEEKITICTDDKCFQIFKEEIIEQLLRDILPGLKVI